MGADFRDIASSEAFAQGYDDALAGKPPRFDDDFGARGRKHVWQYERGRHFAVWCLGYGETPSLWRADRAGWLILNPRAETLGLLMMAECKGCFV